MDGSLCFYIEFEFTHDELVRLEEWPDVQIRKSSLDNSSLFDLINVRLEEELDDGQNTKVRPQSWPELLDTELLTDFTLKV